MEEELSRWDLAEIRRLHDEQGYRCISPDYLACQLEKIGLKPDASRFEIAERIKDIERER